MRTDQRQILTLLNCGRITLTEAEMMFDSAREGGGPVMRIRSWMGARIGSWLALALLAGVVLRPTLVAALDIGMRAAGGPDNLQFLLNRLMEAFL